MTLNSFCFHAKSFHRSYFYTRLWGQMKLIKIKLNVIISFELGRIEWFCVLFPWLVFSLSSSHNRKLGLNFIVTLERIIKMKLKIMNPFYKVVTLYLYDLISCTFLRHVHTFINVVSYRIHFDVQLRCHLRFVNYTIQGAKVPDTACDWTNI